MTRAVELAQVASTGVSEAFKNRIINGAMVIDQRNNGASVSTPVASAWTYFLDRWAYFGSTSGRYSVQRNAGSVTPPAGFTNYLGVTSLAATTVGASDVYDIKQAVEGFNIADLGWGTANARTVTVSFWVRSSLTGSFGGSLSNGDFNRLYPFSYSISAANTWEYKTVTIAGDTTGNWYANNDIGVNVVFGLGVGSTFSGPAGAWATGGIVPTGSVSVVSTNGATWYVTGVQFEVGSTASSFEYRPYGTELALCQRYFQKYSGGLAFWARASTVADGPIRFAVLMRSAPSATQSGNGQLDPITGANISPSSVNIGISAVMADGSMMFADNYSGLTTNKQYYLVTSNVINFSSEL
jgi:hypothetical protein